MTGFPAIVVGVLLAASSIAAAFFAGSDRARIRGEDSVLLVGSVSLCIAALLLEYHA